MPEIGEFYYHYKHDPKKVNDHAYVITGFGWDLENDKKIIFYKPLYVFHIEKEEVKICTRSIENFTEVITRDGKNFPRFKKITDQKIIEELRKIEEIMCKK